MRVAWPSALAISTIWRRDSGRSLTQRARVDVLAADAGQQLLGAPALRAARRSGRSGAAGRRCEMLSATDRSGISDSSWKMQTMPARLALGRAWRSVDLRGRRATSSPSSGCDHAGDDLDQRRLAGAVLAQHGVDRACPAGEVDALQRAHAAIALGDARASTGRARRVGTSGRHGDALCDADRTPRRTLGPGAAASDVTPSLRVLLVLGHDVRGGDVHAAGRERVGGEEVVGQVRPVVLAVLRASL